MQTNSNGARLMPHFCVYAPGGSNSVCLSVPHKMHISDRLGNVYESSMIELDAEVKESTANENLLS